MSTGISDEFCRVEVKQAMGGGYYANYGHFTSPVFRTPCEAASYGNREAQNMYGSTVRLIDLNQFRG